MAELVGVAGRVVDSHAGDGQTVNPVDTNRLLRRVLDV